MGYRFKRSEAVLDGIRRITLEQIDKAIGEIDDDDLDREEAVHQVRKRCKKIRAVVRLVRPAFDDYSDENERFRDLARSISDARDATALLECVDALRKRHEDDEQRAEMLLRLRAALVTRRDERLESLDLDPALASVRDDLDAARDDVEAWTLDTDDDEPGFAAVRGGFEKTYGRARDAMAEARRRPDPERVHEWRKRVKYHRYHMKMLQPTWKPVLGRVRDDLKTLSDLLGDDHDLAVLRAVIVNEGADLGLSEADRSGLLALADLRRRELEALAGPLGVRLFAERPGALSKRFARYWSAWHAERDVRAALPAAAS